MNCEWCGIDLGDAARMLYYVMGYVRGETLARKLDRDGAIDPDETRRILAEIADALRYANAQTVVHRDLKPENILIEDSAGTSFLADFGIARLTGSDGLTRAGAVLGTPLYMAPEQATGAPVDHRSDITASRARCASTGMSSRSQSCAAARS